MTENDRNERQRLGRSETSGTPETGRTGGDSADSQAGREKGTVDKLIDKAQEKGLFDKAERAIRDRFGGGGKRR